MDLHIEERDTTFCVTTQAFSVELPDTPANRKVAVVFLRALKDRHGRPLFTLEQLAAIVGSTNRQAASQHVEEFRAGGTDFKALVMRKRKVDEEVVEALTHELAHDPLATKVELAQRVNERLGRTEFTAANIEAGLAQIPALLLSKEMHRQLAKGTVHYQEEYLLEQALAAVQAANSKEAAKTVSLLERAGIEAGDEVGMTVVRPREELLQALCTPHIPLSAIPWSLQWGVWCLALYGYGVPLRVLGNWMGVDKTTVLRWIVGVAEGIGSLGARWIAQAVTGRTVYLDEKWIKITGRWYYWFVALDGETELPIVHELLPRQSGWSCLWIVVKLKTLRLKVNVFVTDGLKGYRWAISRVFTHATHQLCLFHHQQRVSTCVREQGGEEQERQVRKAEMKQVFQTNDKRTVKHRLARLQAKADEWGIGAWLKRVWDELPYLLPAVGSRRIPRTTNAIERFFRAFNRFYKVRRGFFSVASAKRQMLIFFVFSLFTQGEEGLAPIERVIPEARTMPLYRLMNDPFTVLGLGTRYRHVKQNRPLAETRFQEAA